MTCKWKTTLIGPALWMAGIPLWAEPAEIRVRLQVYVRVSPSVLHEAKEVASFVLEKAGVRLLWAECPTRQEEPSKDAVCLLPVTPRDLQVRIVGKVMAKRANKRSECMGFAVVAGEFSSIANAYYHRADELAAGNMAGRGAILGGIVAHEVGHLLGVTGHSSQGLMRALWDDHDLKTLAKGNLWFGREEARRVAESAARRNTARD